MTVAMPQLIPSASGNIERYTPSYIFEGLGVRFDVDPCAPVGIAPCREWCDSVFSLPTDGLSRDWEGRVWLNPPWTRGAKRHWVAKLKQHGNGIALVRGGVDSKWFHDNLQDGLFLLRRRVQYLRSDQMDERPRKGNAVGGLEPSMLLAFGKDCVGILGRCTLEGAFFVPRDDTRPPA